MLKWFETRCLVTSQKAILRN